MPDTYHTLRELEELFQTLIIDMLSLASGSPLDYDAASYYVRVAWPTDGAPAWKNTETICFLRVSEVDDPINRQREERIIEQETSPASLYLDRELSYNVVLNVNIICYGPNSWEWIQTIRDSVFDENPFRYTLSSKKIYPIPDFVAPRRVPEPFQNQYWERVDFDMRFNANIRKTTEIGTIGSVPVVVCIEDDEMKIEEVNVIVIEE